MIWIAFKSEINLLKLRWEKDMHTFKYSNSIPFNQMQSCAYLIIKKNKKLLNALQLNALQTGSTVYI